MSAHLLIPAWDAEFPATLSRKILIGKLRQELGFQGLIVTDALVMGAIANFDRRGYGANEAAVLAAEAGADVLLMPLDPEGAILAVCDAVNQGRIDIAQIKESVKRIWAAKVKVGLAISDSPQPSVAKRLSDPPQPPLAKGGSKNPPALIDLSTLSTPEARATAADILRDSLKFGGELPLQAKKPSQSQVLRNLIVVDDVLGCEFLGNHTPAIALPAQFGYKLQLIDDRTSSIADNTNAEPSCDLDVNLSRPTLLQVFIRGNCFRGSAGLTEAAQDWFKQLLSNGELQALLIYGSPYVLDQFLPQLPPTIPYIFCYGQMPTAQAIALELLFGIDRMANP
ncbi:MAG TPA: beta-glucosidase, partial [Microcoleaceae bacterium UBA11344]|nr:beta-glucosidase [Microcoleaceae cyanobacterium UBA11344]